MTNMIYINPPAVLWWKGRRWTWLSTAVESLGKLWVSRIFFLTFAAFSSVAIFVYSQKITIQRLIDDLELVSSFCNDVDPGGLCGEPWRMRENLFFLWSRSWSSPGLQPGLQWRRVRFCRGGGANNSPPPHTNVMQNLSN